MHTPIHTTHSIDDVFQFNMSCLLYIKNNAHDMHANYLYGLYWIIKKVIH